MDDYLHTAIAAAKTGGKIFKQYFGRPKHVQTKHGNPRDVVTEVDIAIEQKFRAFIARRYPDHVVLGEEFGAPKTIAANKLIWIIDPIDGTTNFTRGIPFCCISIALWDNRGPLVGVVYNPITGDMFSAAKGCGAFRNNKRIRVSSAAGIGHAFGAVGWSREIALGKKVVPFFIKTINKVRTFGSTALETCYVAAGNYDCFIQARLSIWDVAAGALIVTEAGGKITDWSGKPLKLEAKNAVVTNGKIHKPLLSLIQNI